MQNNASEYYSLIDNETRWMCRIVSTNYTNLHETKLITEAFRAEVNPHLLLEKLKRHRLYPVFYKKWKEWEGKPEGNEWLQFELSVKKLVEKNQIRMMQKTAELIRIVNAFNKEGIPVISLKGPVLAQQLYGNIALKASIDLDILIDGKDFDKAWDCLYSSGYYCPGMEKGFSPKQKRYLIKNFHHLGFTSKSENLQLELHWMLNTNRYLLEYQFGMLYSNASALTIEGSEIKVLSPLHQSIHLMVHGAYHQWARLDWLLDWTTLMEQYKEKERFEEEVKRNGLEIVERQAEILKDIYLYNSISLDASINKKIIKTALVNAGKSLSSIAQERVKEKLYLLKLKSDLKYKTHIFTVLGTNKSDWEVVKLPDCLFFIYYIMRPFLFLTNKKA